MWVFPAFSDWARRSAHLDPPSSSEQLHAVAGNAPSLHQLWLHDIKQQNSELGFLDSLESSQATQLGLQKQLAKLTTLSIGSLDSSKLVKTVGLGFHHQLHSPAGSTLAAGFDHIPAAALADQQVRFHMNLRRLADTPPAPSSSTAQVSPSIVVIIIVLTVIFFLSAFLHLLIRWLARNPSLIRRGVRAGGRSNNRIIALTALQGQLQQLFNIQDAGLERSLIEELPVFSYKAAMGGLKEGADCAICLCEFVGDDQLRLLPLCGHAFHTECIDTWLLSHSTCPLCRALLLPECWVPGMLPLLSSEINTTGDADLQHVPAALAHFTGSSRRSSLGHVSIAISDYNQSELSRHSPFFASPNRMDPGSSVDDRASLEASAAVQGSALAEDRAKSITNEGTSNSAHAKLLTSSSSAYMAAMSMDSGRYSYTSLGNQTDAQSEACTDLDGAPSAYGSGRRVSIHLGKCRMVREQAGKSSFRKSKASADASRRSYSKGSYEYVIDNSSSLEAIIPPATALNAHSKRLNDMINLNNRNATSSVTEIGSNAVLNGPRNSVSKILSPSWATASFRKFRLWDGEDVDNHVQGMSSAEAINAPLNTSLPSDKPEQWPVITPDLPESSTATSMRANVSSNASFSPEMVSAPRLAEVMISHNGASAEQETSKRAVSFRLPTPASHDVLNARLKASASRRALSESEAFSHWDPSFTEQLDQAANDGHIRIAANDTADAHRSSSFAKRTIDWLVGWQRRIVHPDKSTQQANTSCN